MATFSHFSIGIGKCRARLEHILKLWPLLVVVLVLAFLYGIEVHEVQGISSKMSNIYEGHARAAFPDMHVPLSLIHYATTNITPQQTKEEIMVTAHILNRRGPCNLLVFGLGHDSLMWQTLNLGGNTVFLEEDPRWIEEMKGMHPSLRSVAVSYRTRLSQAEELLGYARDEKDGVCSPEACADLRESRCESLVMKGLPDEIYETKWDVIMIDAPRGYFAEAPGRMSAIFSAAVMAMNYDHPHHGAPSYTDILLHDVDRHVEKTFSEEFLCKNNLVESVGKLWHFQIHGRSQHMAHHFCTNT